jgi:predicted nucleic acid-binding protein
MTSSGNERVDRIVLDTSAYSQLRRGHPEVLSTIAAARTTFLPATVLGELEAAFELGSRPRENRVMLAEFLGEPFVATLPVTAAVARRYGQIFAALRRAGTPISTNDIWIAAAALDCGGRLLTFDRDFAQIIALDCRVLEA